MFFTQPVADNSQQSRFSPVQFSRLSAPQGYLVNDKQPPTTQELQDEITTLKQQVDQLQKMSALGELVSTTTHEFNNVLMTIMNYAKLGMRHDDKATRDKAFDKINTASNRAAKITNAVLGMARNRGNQFEQTDLAKLIDETMVLLEREMSKYRIAVEMEIGRASCRERV